MIRKTIKFRKGRDVAEVIYMKKKICLLHPADWAEDSSYAKGFVLALDRIKNPDTEYFIKACPPGPGKYPVIDYFMNALEIPKLCTGAMEAEKEGADAILLACTDDPGLRILRTLVDIPVVGGDGISDASGLHAGSQVWFGLLADPALYAPGRKPD